MLRKPFNFVIFFIPVSKNFDVSANWTEKKGQT